jgi:hypothetical protein
MFQEDTFLQVVADAVTRAAGGAVQDGRATITVSPERGEVPPVVSLVPAGEKAAPVAVQLDDQNQATLYLGRYGTVCELWETEPDELVEAIEVYVGAIVSGQYEETVHLIDGELLKARGKVLVNGRLTRIWHSDLTAGRGRRTKEKLVYDPY